MNELKPCPFCGGKAKKAPCLAQYCDYEMVVCTVCGADISKNTMKKAIEAWNRRNKDE